MNNCFKELENWNKIEPLLVRIDYGYQIPLRFVKRFDALFTPISEIKEYFEVKRNNGFFAVFNSHYLLSPRRRQSLFQNFIKTLEGKPVVLETRFSKSFESFCSFLAKEGIKFSKIDCKSDGSLPPLYSSISLNRELFFKNLLYEWESGLQMARGRSSLIDIAKIIAQSEKPMTLSEISEKMELTLGAVASYLNWMEDASLIRKENKRYMLRHQGFYYLFKENALEKIQVLQKIKKEDPMDLD